MEQVNQSPPSWMFGVGRTLSSLWIRLSSLFSSLRNEAIGEVRWRTYLLLAALFVAAFSVPMLIGLRIGGLFPNSDRDSNEGKKDLFPQAIEFSSAGAYARISDAPSLLPQPGEDFLVLAWFNLRKLPAIGQRLVLLSKYEGASSRLGYAIGLSRESGSLRPVVYWADSKVKDGRPLGRWYDFAEVNILPRSWFLFALSFHNDQFLGVHLGTATQGSFSPSELNLLGGYDVGSLEVPMGNADIISGAFQDRMFRGSLGPLGIFSGHNLSRDLKSVLKQSIKDPHKLPEGIDSSEVKLWIPTGSNDVSSFAHKIEFFGSAGRNRLEK